jgi:DHA3 family macrolide efflux protein-like MFS transporter
LRLQLPDVLRIPGFRNLLLGQGISQLGDAFYYVAFMFMVKKVTGSDSMVGLVGALETLPFLFFGPYAGVLADRMDRRRIMLVSDLVCGAALVLFGAVILIGGKPPIWALLVTPFLLSTVRVFFMPSKSAALPALVPPTYLLRANSLSMTVQNLMPMISLAVSAAVLSQLYRLSPVWFYSSTVFLNAISFLGSAIFIARLPVLLPDRKEMQGAERPHVLADLKDGFGYLKSRHDLNVMTAMLAVFRLCVAPFFVVYLAANDAWFGGRPETITWFEFSFFVGMVVATGFVGRLNPKRPGRWFAWGLGAVGLTVAAMAFSPHFWLFILWNVLAGLMVPIADVPMITYIQKSVPDAYRGRVNAVRDMVATGVMPIGMGLAGILVKEAGLTVAFLTMGIGMAAACFAGLFDPKFRDVEMPEDPPETPAEAKRDVAYVG